MTPPLVAGVTFIQNAQASLSETIVLVNKFLSTLLIGTNQLCYLLTLTALVAAIIRKHQLPRHQ